MKQKGLTDPPDRLDDLARKRIKAHVEKRWPGLVGKLGDLWADCRDWHLANGVQRASWEATFRRWIKKEVEIQRRPTAKQREKPRETGQRGDGALTPLLDMLKGGKNG